MRTPTPPLLPILRSRLVGDLLALLTRDAERTWTAEELAERTGAAYPTVTRELRHLDTAGLLTTRALGRTKLVQANAASPYFRPLAELVAAAFGPPLVLGEELATVPGVDAAFLYGSWAARHAGQPGATPNDLDVLVVGKPDRDALHDAARRAERRLAQPVNTTVRTPTQWRTGTDGFTRQLKASPLVPLLDGSDAYLDDHAPLASRRSRHRTPPREPASPTRPR